MTVTAAHLRELNALGIVGDTLIRVVEIIDEASAAVLGQSMDKSSDVRGRPLESTAESHRKERDKLRKRLERAADKAQKLTAKTSTDVQGQSKDASADSALSSPTYLISSSLTSSGEPLKKSKRDGLRARGTRLSVGAPLTEEFIHVAIEAGASRGAIPKIWVEFVDYWSDIPGQRGCKLSWLGTWRNNVKRVLGNGHGSGKNGHGGFNGSRGSSGANFFAGLASLAADIAGDDPAPRPADPAVPLGKFNIDG